MSDNKHSCDVTSESRFEDYSQRMLSFFATTLKSLDNPVAVSKSTHDVMSEAARIAVNSLAHGCRIALRADFSADVFALSEKSIEPVWDFLKQRESKNPEDLLSSLRVIRSGVTVIKEDLATCPQASALKLRSYICVPIKISHDTIGSLTFIRSMKADKFDSIDLLMAEEFANKVGKNVEMSLLYKNLEDLKTAAEVANRAKTNFLANVSHEIRTPLGSILGFSELLVATSSDENERQDWGNKIRRNGGHLLRIIDDILDLSKVEVGKLDLEIRKVDLKNLLQDLFFLATHLATGKSIKLDFGIEDSLPRYIYSDETRLSQILSNIIGNAIKFTSVGFVRLRVKSSKDVANLLSFEVTDTGIGVAAEQAGMLFQPFSQAENSRTRHYGGTGLGLALSRNLAQALGGGLCLKESELDKGSSFLITIQAPAVVDSEQFQDLDLINSTLVPTKEEDLSSALLGKNILLVEDSSDLQVLVKRVLEGSGAVISLADNGEEGLKAAQEFSYDVVLMDVQMPGKDGCQVVQELRSLGNRGLIIALTANAMKEEHDRCLEAGYDAHLSKPMRKNDLIRNIVRISDEYHRKASISV